ncbi:MAG: glycoside hydrolase family 3 protein [Treponema sp.]|jgi:beta-glucosidase|nr:glycoside hydrolase family 3 protein [Treponema sp.]
MAGGIDTMAEKFTKIQKDGYSLYLNQEGAVLGAGPGMEKYILVVDGFAFKDLNRNGVLDPYEDWRLPWEERIGDLASRMSIEEIAGLMLYSSHQSITKVNPFAALGYRGREEQDTREHVWDLTEGQKNFLQNDHLRHVLLAQVESTAAAARWNNQAQAFAETLGLGIPINISSDPRHTPKATAEYDLGAGGDISLWPDALGLAAAFDPALVRCFAGIAAREYRAMGITTALSPQVDLATDPRWSRFNGTFGEGSKLAVDLARAYCDGFQNSPKTGIPGAGDSREEIAGGWGFGSVNAMVKHWPGGGTGEGGRDAHFGFGKYAVYPGRGEEEHLKPFTEGAFKLEGKTGKASAVMPYYTISWGYDRTYGENVGNSYSRYIVTDLLREKYGYDGVVCTDWGITADPGPVDLFFSGKCWGVEELSAAERHYKILMAGADQFGGNNDKVPVLEAYAMGVREHGEEFMRNRFVQSAKRLLRNIYRTGLFENPFVDPEDSPPVKREFISAGFQAQLRSIVLLKNAGSVLPLRGKTKVYIPRRRLKAGTNFFGMATAERDLDPLDPRIVGEYFEQVTSPEAADFALCIIESPRSVGGGYLKDQGYIPISLQYRPYRADTAREKNIAGNEDRSYRGKTAAVSNEGDLDLVLDTRKKMGSKPVIVVVQTANPFAAAEFEGSADAILLCFSVEPRAVLDIITGKAEPSALLPFRMPRDMATVEAQAEDLAFDMIPYTDSTGNTWDFAFGLNWQGPIRDGRVEKYSHG